MLIVDASCLFEVVTGRPKAELLRHRLGEDEQSAAHIIDAEVFGVVRREYLRDHLTGQRRTRR